MRLDVPAHLERIGSLVQKGVRELAGKHGLPLTFSGHPCLQYFAFDPPEALALQTLWTARMLTRGVMISGGFYPTYAHQEGAAALGEVADAMAAGDIEGRIGGPVKMTGLRRLA